MARAEIRQKISVVFWAMEFQEKLLLRFPDFSALYSIVSQVIEFLLWGVKIS